MLNPWIIVGVLVALVTVGAGGYFKGESAGKAKVEAAWQQRESKINAESANNIAAANDRVREVERATAMNIAAVDTTYQGKLREKSNALDIALNAVRSGAVRLSGHGAACPAPAGNPAGPIAAGAGIGDGGARSQFSQQDSEFLLRIGSEADAIVAQLQACQQVIRADRREGPINAVK